MKRTLIALAMLALIFSAWQQTKADVEVNFDFFYNNISGGNWIEVGDYGYCWQPDVAVNNPSWRPYADGYWAYTDVGWTWVSYEDFGWATYHYGRWAHLDDYGWVWVPGRDADLEWGPAWVSWRTGGEYVGWAPLPPETMVVVEGRAITGHLDVEFNIGPAYYNFVDVRYIGEPVLRERIIASTQNVTYIQQTVNVTNITYRNKIVYNYGPDIKVINSRANRPIQQLRIEHPQNVDFSAAAKSGALTKVQGDRLVVAGPMRVTRSVRTVAPPNVKTKVDKAKIDRGWSAVGDEKAQAEFKQKIGSQDLKNVPPPTGGAGAANQSPVATSPVAGTSPAASVAPATSVTPFERGKGKNRNNLGELSPAGSPAGSPAAGASPMGKGKFDRETPAATASPAGASSKTNLNSSKSNIYKSAPSTPGETSTELPKGKGKSQLERSTLAPTPGTEGSTELPKGKGKAKQFKPMGTPAGGGNESPMGGPIGGGKQGRKFDDSVNADPRRHAGGPAAAGGGEHGKEKAADEGAKGKGKKGEASPVPSPQ